MKITVGRMKFCLIGVAAILVCAFTIGATVPIAAAQSPITLRAASYLPENYPSCALDKWWMQEVERRTNKAVKFEFFPAGSLVKGPDLLPSLKKNMVQIAASAAPGYHTSIFRLYRIVEAMNFTEDPAALMKAYLKVLESTPALMEEYKREGMHVLYAPPVTTMLFGTRKMVTKMEDLKGLKIRAVGTKSKLVSELGAVPVAVTGPEIYDSLHKGVIDGATVLDFGNLNTYKLNEVLPYIIDTGFGVYAALVTAMNLETWRGLPPHVQKVMTEVSGETGEKYAKEIMTVERRSLDLISTSKGQITRLSPDEKARWAAISKRVLWDGWSKEVEPLGVKGNELLAQFAKLCKEYEKGSGYTSIYDVWDKEYAKK